MPSYSVVRGLPAHLRNLLRLLALSKIVRGAGARRPANRQAHRL